MQKLIDILLIIALLSTLSLLQGCSTIQYVNVPIFPSTPAFMTQECEEMEYLNGTDFTLDYFINITINNSVKYRDCLHLNHVKSLWVIETKQNMEDK